MPRASSQFDEGLSAGRCLGDVAAAKIPLHPAVGRTLFAVAWVITLAALTWSMLDSNALFLAFGAAACAIVLLPTVGRERYDLLSPWSFVILAVFIGCGIRSLFVAFGVDGSRSVEELFLLGEPPSFFIYPALLYLLGLTVMVLAYSQRRISRRKTSLGDYLARYRFDQRVYIVVAACAVVSFVAFVLYVQRTGGFDFSRISAKRTTIPGLELTDSYQSHGSLRALSELGSLAFWAMLAQFAHRGVRHSIFSIRGVALLALFLNAAALPIYASSRADVIYLLLIAAAIELCLQRRRSYRQVVIRTGAVALIAASALTLLRVSPTSTSYETPTDAFVHATGDAFVFNRNFSDIPTSAQIINRVPEVLPYEYGSTIAEWVVAPVPRSLWPDKPIVSSGPTLGITIFRSDAAGVPPGFIAEMYWNFGVPGIVAGAWLFGTLLRRLYTRYIPDVQTSPASALVYATIIIKFGVDTMTNSLGYAIFTALWSALILVALLAVSGSTSSATALTARRRHAPHTGRIR